MELMSSTSERLTIINENFHPHKLLDAVGNHMSFQMDQVSTALLWTYCASRTLVARMLFTVLDALRHWQLRSMVAEFAFDHR